MTSFCIHESSVALCNNECVLIYNTDDNTERRIDLPDLAMDKTKVDPQNCNASNIETNFHTITNVAFSRDGNYFLVCTNRKQLCLYERQSCKLLFNKTLVRAASRVRFSPSNDIIVADKAGDAYLFCVSSSDASIENGVLLLGHLSMLLDALITEDERYIVTTDRDEKIRVSMFPNSYNILSYCLGHSKFVTNISELPHDKSVLVSAGGDGVLMMWDYKIARELFSVDFHKNISKNDTERFNQQLRVHHCTGEESVEILPVKHLRLCKLDPMASLVVMSFYSSSLLLVYVIVGSVETGFQATHMQSIIEENEPIECLLHKTNLWVMSSNLEFKVYELSEARNFIPAEALNSTVKHLNNSCKTLKKQKEDMLEHNLFPILYKRKYDNIQEYLERKKTRLANITK